MLSVVGPGDPEPPSQSLGEDLVTIGKKAKKREGKRSPSPLAGQDSLESSMMKVSLLLALLFYRFTSACKN